MTKTKNRTTATADDQPGVGLAAFRARKLRGPHLLLLIRPHVRHVFAQGLPIAAAFRTGRVGPHLPLRQEVLVRLGLLLIDPIGNGPLVGLVRHGGLNAPHALGASRCLHSARWASRMSLRSARRFVRCAPLSASALALARAAWILLHWSRGRGGADPTYQRGAPHAPGAFVRVFEGHGGNTIQAHWPASQSAAACAWHC